MYLENDKFGEWMQKLYAKLEELCKDVRVLRNADKVLPEDDNLLDNQDLCLLFKVSIKTLQRYRAIGVLPYFTISGKVYYKASDVREFIKERWDFVQKGRGAIPYLERGIGDFCSICDRQSDQPVDALPDRRKLFYASVFYADSGGMPGDGVF